MKGFEDYIKWFEGDKGFPEGEKRNLNFLEVYGYLPENPTILECGTMNREPNQQGGSTMAFAIMRKLKNGQLFSVDNDWSAIKYASDLLKSYEKGYEDHVHFICQDFRAVFRGFFGSIDLLFIDAELPNEYNQDVYCSAFQALPCKPQFVLIDDVKSAEDLHKGEYFIPFITQEFNYRQIFLKNHQAFYEKTN